MSGWNLLHCAEDWEAYRSQAHTDMGQPGLLIWGRGPQSYPCLVTHLPKPGTMELIVAYVYPNDAKKLMTASTADNPPGPNTESVLRWHTAQHLTAAYFITETALATKEKYETKLAEMLEAVDLYKKDKIAGLKAAGLAGNLVFGDKTGF